MHKFYRAVLKLKDQKGATAIIVAVSLLVLLGFAAFAVDFGHRHVVQNELQNASDAGSLAGARQLYYEDGSAVNAGQSPTSEQPDSANQVAYDSAIANLGQGVPVELNDYTSNNGDVQRGHWSFSDTPPLCPTTGTYDPFCPNVSTTPTVIAGVSEEDLDKDTNFINAVRVVTRRQITPVLSFFARIFGFGDYNLSAEAVAYIGFAGTLMPDEVDQPIVICYQSIWNEAQNKIECNYGRMQNSDSTKDDDSNTGGWTDFSQRPCDQTNADEMKDILSDCTTGNPHPIIFGEGIGATGGVVDNIFGSATAPNKPSLFNCWKSGIWDANHSGIFGDSIDGVDDHPIDKDGDDWPEYPWAIKVPVIDCLDNNVKKCSTVLGAMTVYVVWMLDKENKINDDAPYKMHKPDGTLWENYDPNGQVRWDSFVGAFGLKTSESDLPATVANDGFKKKSIYFLPNCLYNSPPAGTSGGTNFGIQAKIPVLVD